MLLVLVVSTSLYAAFHRVSDSRERVMEGLVKVISVKFPHIAIDYLAHIFTPPFLVRYGDFLISSVYEEHRKPNTHATYTDEHPSPPFIRQLLHLPSLLKLLG
jgi:hypothetical protein